MKHSLLIPSVLLLFAPNLLPQASWSAPRIYRPEATSVTETANAVYFTRVNYPQNIFYTRKYEPSLKCETNVSNPRFQHCQLSVVPKAGSHPDEDVLTVRPEWKGLYFVAHRGEDTGTCELMLKSSALKPRLHNLRMDMKPSDFYAEGTLCRFSFIILDIFVGDLQAELNDATPTETPVKWRRTINLARVTPLGTAMYRIISQDLNVAPGTEMSRDHAIFLTGVAAGKAREAFEGLSRVGSEQRAAFYDQALNQLFATNERVARFNPSESSPLSISLREELDYGL